MTSHHPDTPRSTGVDEELDESTKPQLDEVSTPDLVPELGPDELEEIGEGSGPGQNSDWLPQ